MGGGSGVWGPNGQKWPSDTSAVYGIFKLQLGINLHVWLHIKTAC